MVPVEQDYKVPEHTCQSISFNKPLPMILLARRSTESKVSVWYLAEPSLSVNNEAAADDLTYKNLTCPPLGQKLDTHIYLFFFALALSHHLGSALFVFLRQDSLSWVVTSIRFAFLISLATVVHHVGGRECQGFSPRDRHRAA
ncbi:jg6186 [Pararge aegeria aegeria]|uniref:Jg6186 protein n=1 Tax=Pararge aegeria aegeria TaxID=348720 RepID=A0A8S4S379_9NEOP|nr:jg6186 [Pararge aegeria aegeria]